MITTQGMNMEDFGAGVIVGVAGFLVFKLLYWIFKDCLVTYVRNNARDVLGEVRLRVREKTGSGYNSQKNVYEYAECIDQKFEELNDKIRNLEKSKDVKLAKD